MKKIKDIKNGNLFILDGRFAHMKMGWNEETNKIEARNLYTQEIVSLSLNYLVEPISAKEAKQINY